MNSSKLATIQKKSKSPVKAKSKATTKNKSVKKELVEFVNKNKKTLTSAAIGSTALGLYAINRKAIHVGLGNVLNRVTKPTQKEIINTIKDELAKTIQNTGAQVVDGLKNITQNTGAQVVDGLKNITQNIEDIKINIVNKNNMRSEEEKQQIKDAEEYLIFKENFNRDCSNYFKTPGGFPCENQKEADDLVMQYIISEDGQKKVKEFQELKLVKKIEKYLVDTQQLESVCSTYNQTFYDYIRSCNNKNAADLLVRDFLQKYKTDPEFKKKIPK